MLQLAPTLTDWCQKDPSFLTGAWFNNHPSANQLMLHTSGDCHTSWAQSTLKAYCIARQLSMLASPTAPLIFSAMRFNVDESTSTTSQPIRITS